MSSNLHVLGVDANDPLLLARFWAEALGGWGVDVIADDEVELVPTDGTRFTLQEILLSQLTNFLYDDGRSPAGDPFEGLSGAESCPGPDGAPVSVYPITPQTPNAYFLPPAAAHARHSNGPRS